MAHVHLLISSVTDEFGSYRDKLDQALDRPSTSVKIQRRFVDMGTTTLLKLDAYIREAHGVLHLVGERTGAPINAAALRDFRSANPHLAADWPALADALRGTTPCSYTQWEAYLARIHNKKLFVFLAAPDAERDPVKSDTSTAPCQSQADHLARLHKLGFHPNDYRFTRASDLGEKFATEGLVEMLVEEKVREARETTAPPRPTQSLLSTLRRRTWWRIVGGLVLLAGGSFPGFMPGSPPYGAPIWVGVWSGLLLLGGLIGWLIRRMIPEPPPPPSSAILKELRPFGLGDAALFKKLQREDDVTSVRQALDAVDFRFGVLYGESGCGKTSFLQAGLGPALAQQCVYVKFTNRAPLAVLREAVAQAKLVGVSAEAVAQAQTFPELVRAIRQTNAEPLVFLFDQFEQYFQHRDPKQPLKDDPFAQGLAAWYGADNGWSVKILVGLRFDFMDRLIDFQPVVGYTLAPQDSRRLEKFSPAQATAVFRAIAAETQMPFDDDFVEQVTAAALRDGADDHRISPVRVQIVATMLYEQDNPAARAFTNATFNRLGGIEALFERFLEKRLDLPKARRDAAIKVLLALTDLEQDTRAGVLTVAQIAEKASVPHAQTQEAVQWLADSRLLTAVEQNTAEAGYELAHEQMIKPLRKVANLLLDGAAKANQLLDRRVKEWLGNNKSSYYLPGPWEWWQIRRHRAQLVWGGLKLEKEALFAQTLTKWKRRLAGAGVVLVLAVGGWGTLQTNQGIIWRTKRALRVLAQERPTDVEAQVSQVKSYLLDEQVAEALAMALTIAEEDSKASALISIAEAYGNLDNAAQGARVLGEALAVAKTIATESSKFRVLSSIAEVAGMFGDAVQGERVLSETLAVAQTIADEDYKSRALTSIAEAAGKLGDPAQGARVLGEALAVAKTFAGESSKADALASIAEANGKLDDTAHRRVLDEALAVAKTLAYESSESRALASIAKAYGKIGDLVQGARILDEALAVAKGIANESSKASVLASIAETAGSLGDAVHGAQVLGEARVIAKTFVNVYSKAGTLASIAEAYEKLGNAPQGARVLDETLAVTKAFADEYSKAGALDSIAKVAGKLGNAAQSARVLGEALSIAKTFADEAYKAGTLASIAEAAGSLGDAVQDERVLRQILAVAKTFADEAYKARVLGSITKAAGNLGDAVQGERVLGQILAVAKTFADEDSKASTLGSIAEAYGKLGNAVQGERVLSQILAVAKTFADEDYKVSALASIAEAYGKLGNAAQGARILGEALVLTKTFDYESYKASALGSIAEAAENLGDAALGERVLGEALKIANTFADEAYKSRELGSIAEVAGKRGLWKIAYEAAQDIQIDKRDDALYKILEARHAQQHLRRGEMTARPEVI